MFPGFAQVTVDLLSPGSFAMNDPPSGLHHQHVGDVAITGGGT